MHLSLNPIQNRILFECCAATRRKRQAGSVPEVGPQSDLEPFSRVKFPISIALFVEDSQGSYLFYCSTLQRHPSFLFLAFPVLNPTDILSNG